MSRFSTGNCFSEKYPEQIGNIMMVLLSDAISCFLDPDDCSRIKVGSNGSQNSGSGRGSSLKIHASFLYRQPFNYLCCCGGRYWQIAMIAFYKTTTKFNCRNMYGFNIQSIITNC